MDSAHQAHLERILENRRRRGLADPRDAASVRATSVARSIEPQEQPPPPAQASSLAAVAPAAQLVTEQPQGRSTATQQVPRTFSTVSFGSAAPPVRMPSEQPARTAAESSNLYSALAAQRDAFTDFRNHPVLTTPLVKSYGAPAVSAAVPPVAYRPSVTMRTAVVEPRVTQPNPFRTQPFEKFVEAPSYAAPAEMQALSPDPHMMERSRGGLDVHQLDTTRDEAVFDIRQSIHDLRQGDWFMKWTSKRDKVHRRYFWLDTDRASLYWAKSAGASVYLSSSLKIEEIAEIQASCVVDDASGKTLYILIIVCLTRALQIGTELRDKFDKWHDALERLSKSQRQYNNRFYGRYTTAPPRRNALEQHMRAQQFAASPAD